MTRRRRLGTEPVRETEDPHDHVDALGVGKVGQSRGWAGVIAPQAVLDPSDDSLRHLLAEEKSGVLLVAALRAGRYKFLGLTDWHVFIGEPHLREARKIETAHGRLPADFSKALISDASVDNHHRRPAGRHSTTTRRQAGMAANSWADGPKRLVKPQATAASNCSTDTRPPRFAFPTPLSSGSPQDHRYEIGCRQQA